MASANTRSGQQCTNERGAGSLAEERHVVPIAPERGDVGAHPLERGHNVEKAAVRRVLGPVTDRFLARIRHGEALSRPEDLEVAREDGEWSVRCPTWEAFR